MDNKTIAFLKLIRVENLAMIALTQILLRYCILQKVLMQGGIALGLNDGLFYLVVFSTVLIAAAGYIINDYFDLKTDLINRPDTVVVDRVIRRRTAIILHITFTFLGIIIGMYAALKTGYLRFAIFHFAAAILLWVYSTHLKKTLLIGNILVSLLTASVIFMPLVYEMGTMHKLSPGFISSHKYLLFAAFRITCVYSIFAFITSLAREIIKDIEDYQGDKATGGTTMPIVWGVLPGKIISFFLLVITAILLFFVVYNTIKAQRILLSLNTVYISIALILPLLLLSLYVLKAEQRSHFKTASRFLKFIMLAGLCYSFIFYYT